MSKYLFITILFILSGIESFCQPPVGKKWKLVWNDEFNSNEQLDSNWIFQNGTNKNVQSTRWRENALVENGELKLLNKKQARDGKSFTTANLWSKKNFKYGYFECRYKYGSATGLNNSFWLKNIPENQFSPVFEIDINEGHYPNEIATNIHRHNPPPKTSDSKIFRIGQTSDPIRNIVLKTPVSSSQMRLITKNFSRVHVSEIRIFESKGNGQSPQLTADGKSKDDGYLNLCKKAKISATSSYNSETQAQFAVDDNLNTRWSSSDLLLSDTLSIVLDKTYSIGSIQLVSGWKHGNAWQNPVYNFTIEAKDANGSWNKVFSSDESVYLNNDFSKNFQTFGLEWNENEIIWYFNRKQIRKSVNVFCKGETPIWLSSAVLQQGPITDLIDGTKMCIDYVRVYQTE